MIENIEQAKKHLKGIIDFYKLNDENNYDYTDKDLISIRIVLEEIERLNNIIKEAIDYIDDNTYYKDHKGNINIDDVYIILQKGSE